MRNTKKGIITILLLGTISVLWLHGRTLFFWDSILPLHPLKDLMERTYTWNAYYGRGFPNQPNRFLVYIGSYLVFYLIAMGKINIAQQLLIYALFSGSGVSMFLLLQKVYSARYKEWNFYGPLIGALFYMFNFFTVYNLSEIYVPWFLYSFFPLFLYLFIVGLERHLQRKGGYGYLLLSILVVELMSSSFYEPPYLVFFIILFLIALYSFFPTFSFSRGRESTFRTLTFFSIFITLCVIANLWWEYNISMSVSSDVHSLSLGFQVAGTEYMYKHVLWPFQFLVITAVYPTVRPIVPNNTWSWIYLFGNSYFTPLFLTIGVILLVITFFPLVNVKRNIGMIPPSSKIRFYLPIMVMIFFVLLGQNPAMGYVYDLVASYTPPLIPYLYAIWYPFSEMLIVFFIAVFLPNGIYEFIHGASPKTGKVSNGKKIILKTGTRKKIAVILLALILVIYPWYMYTPYATQQYATGTGQPITSTVSLPSYFLNATEYISTHAGDSGTLILPESYDFMSMNFSSQNSFANDQNPDYLTGTQIIFGGNTMNEIDSLLYYNGITPSNLSVFLNTLNIRYILVNTIEIDSANGYTYYNLSHLLDYLSHQNGIREIKSGKIMIFENMYYDGIIGAYHPAEFNASLKTPYGYDPVISNMSALSVLGAAHNASYNYSNSAMHFKVSHYNFTKNVYRYYNTNDLSINITKYRYLIVTAQTSSNMFLNIRSKTFFNAASSIPFGSTLLSNLNYTLYNNTDSLSLSIPGTSISAENYTTYVFPLYDQPFDNQFSYHLQNDSKSPTFNNSDIVNHLILLFSLKPSNSSYYANITQISFAKYISQNDVYMPVSINNNSNVAFVSSGICVSNGSKKSILPILTYKEIDPSTFLVSVRNATTPFLITLKQNFNKDWGLINRNGTDTNFTHLMADGYANSWYITSKGNFTFEISFKPQDSYERIEYISLSANVLIIASAIIIMLWRRRW